MCLFEKFSSRSSPLLNAVWHHTHTWTHADFYLAGTWFYVIYYVHHTTSWAFRMHILKVISILWTLWKVALSLYPLQSVSDCSISVSSITVIPVVQAKALLLLTQLPSLSPALCYSSWPVDPSVDSPIVSIPSFHSHCHCQIQPFKMLN